MPANRTSRREFLKGSAAGTAAAAGVVATSSFAAEDVVSVNPNAKSLMPNGQLMTREEILKSLNLNPNLAPEAWLAITSCGSNAAAAPDAAVLEGLKNKTIQLDQLKPEEVQRLKDFLSSGNAAISK